MKRTGVSGVFCAAHYPRGETGRPQGNLHGHTWQVIAWFEPHDAEVLRDELALALKTIDHKMLPPHLAWGEDLAEWIGTGKAGPFSSRCLEVRVERALEHIYGDWRAPHPQLYQVDMGTGRVALLDRLQCETVEEPKRAEHVV
jgi:hypothetical protein